MFLRAARIAADCSGAKSTFARAFAHSTAASAFIGGRSDAAREILARLPAIFRSAKSSGADCNTPSPTRFTSPDAKSLSTPSAHLAGSACKSDAARDTISPKGAQVPPSSSSSERAWRTPASMRSGLSFEIPIFNAILSAVLKPIPSISRQSLYGLERTISALSGPNRFIILTHMAMPIP